MEVTVLGCSGGYIEPGRPCSGYLVRAGGTRLLLDAGTGTLERLLAVSDPWELDAIWITHLHPDHWSDLPALLHRMAVTADRWDRPPVAVHGPQGWEEATGVAAQQYPPDRTPYVAATIMNGVLSAVGDLRVSSLAVEHRMEAFGFRIEGPTSLLAYSGDTAPCQALVDLASGADVLLCEATLPTDRTSPISMNAAQAAEIATKAAVDRLVLTHLLPDTDASDAYNTASRLSDGEVIIAEPDLAISVG